MAFAHLFLLLLPSSVSGAISRLATRARPRGGAPEGTEVAWVLALLLRDVVDDEAHQDDHGHGQEAEDVAGLAADVPVLKVMLRLYEGWPWNE